MSSSKFTPFCFFFIPSALFLVVASGESQITDHVCPTSENFTSGDLYERNLAELLGYLVDSTPSTGYGMVSKGEGQNRVFGHALCRTGITADNCTDCLVRALHELQSVQCKERKGAAMWDQLCHLKYLNVDFFGQMDRTNWYFQSGDQNVSEPVVSFDEKVTKLLNGLAEEASTDSTMQGRSDVELGGEKRLYGLVQCTRDLTIGACKRCLVDSIASVRKCCSGKKLAMFYSGSCYVTLEVV